jgi:hypothetical protein
MNAASDNSARDRQLEAILYTYLQAVDAGQAPDRDAFLRQHPGFASELASFFAEQDEEAEMAQSMAAPRAAAETPTTAPGQTPAPAPGTHLRCFGDYELRAPPGRVTPGPVSPGKIEGCGRTRWLKARRRQNGGHRGTQRRRMRARSNANERSAN